MPRTQQEDAITPRQRQSQAIMREKMAKKRREEIRRKVRFIGGAVLGVVVVGVGGFSYYSGAFTRTLDTMSNGFYNTTIHAGLKVNSLHIEGRSRTPMAEIQQALGVKKNDAILKLSLSEMRDRLQAVPSIREAAVERALPGALYVRIVEREPVALWQNRGTVTLVDDKGVIMQGLDIAPYRHLPLIVGDGAPQHVQELMQVMETSPELMKRFASAIRVGDRRWNIRLQDDVEIKLPEDRASEALARLESLDKDDRVLERAVKVIDLRVPDKVFIKLSPELFPTHSAIGAKET